MQLKRIFYKDICIMIQNRPAFIMVLLALLLTASNTHAQTKTKPTKKTEQKSTRKTPVKKKPTASGTTQTGKKVSEPKPVEKLQHAEGTGDEQKVKDIIAFLQYMLNTLGNSATSSRDKDVLITQSYTKVFRDDKVQIEDDLDEERKVITNKDVVAYLKDVDFFYKDVKFEFIVNDIKSGSLPGGQQFYKVSLTRNLTGTTSDGKPVNSAIPRYMEINYNPEDQDLKIVSIYTNEFDEKETLTNWWNNLSFEWQAIFRKKLNLQDSAQLADIKKITTIDELDLSNNSYIQNIEPLAQLVDLKLLDISNTRVEDLTPIRNLTALVELNLSNTKIKDLTPLKYAVGLQRLDISNTAVDDISALEKMKELNNLEMQNTIVSNFGPLRNLSALLYLNLKGTQLSALTPVDSLYQLMELNVASTRIQDLNPIKDLKNLVSLTLDSTRIQNFAALSNLTNLQTLQANYTLLIHLEPLKKLPRLEKIYCDQTLVKREEADAFMKANHNVLVIFDTKDLKNWWETISHQWQNVFTKAANLSLNTPEAEQTPSKEDLAKVTNLDSINISGHSAISHLEPLKKLQKLEVLIAGRTAIRDISPIQKLREIRYIDISETGVSDLSILKQFSKLEVLRADRSRISSLEPLYGLSTLKTIYVDQTSVIDINAREFLEQNPKCLIIYKTNHLNRWWSNLSGDWKQIFRSQMDGDTIPSRENLHQIAEIESLQFKDVFVDDLNVLSEFVRLKALHFSGTAISHIPALENIRSLKSLHATHSPIQKIESLMYFSELEDLDISNTPVDELKAVGSLQKLKMLNAAGTQIKKLDPLKRLQDLEYLDCSNTKVGNIDPILHLPLKTLKAYNTKISEREIKNFKAHQPESNVIYYR